MKKNSSKPEKREESISKVNYKLEQLPTDLAKEVEQSIDYLTEQDKNMDIEVPQWQQNLVLQRIQDNLPMEDAFKMIEELETSDEL